MPISFYTNAGNGSFNNLRMWIKDDGGTSSTDDGRPNDGFVGIGDFSTTTGTGTTPQEHLHLIDITDQGGDLYEQFTNTNTTHKAKRGLLVGLNFASSYLGGLTNPGDFSFAKIIQEEDAPLKIYTLDSARMIINSNYNPVIHGVAVNTNGYIGMGLPYFWHEELGILPGASEGPRSLLHLQGPYNAYVFGGNGWRAWNRTGIYMNENSDEIYVGLKNEFNLNGTNRSDAVIMWGDDQTSADNGDCFRIIFSGSSGGNGNGSNNPRDPATFNGLETVRITSFGRMGIGPLFDWNNQPARRLEILDLQRKSDGTSLNEPQLRLTYNQTTAINSGIWTDFQTTNLGDLYIHPSAVNVNRRVGINTSTPQNTLEINGTGNATPNYAAGVSGLTFNDLAQTSPSAGVGTYSHFLTVDGSGTVVLADPPAGGGGVNACAGGLTNINYITKITGSNQICRTSGIYEGTDAGTLGKWLTFSDRLKIDFINLTFKKKSDEKIKIHRRTNCFYS
ncbi:hypothetical protein BH11BAC1_BH11BAC1_23750 [soil metagenome]